MACIKKCTRYCSRCAELEQQGRISWSFDLQLFNEEKTEDATPKRLQEAREKGQVAKSTEINATVSIILAFFVLQVLGSFIFEELGLFMRHVYSNFSTQDLTFVDLQLLFIEAVLVMLKTAFPIMATLAFSAVVMNLLQVGFIFSLEPLMPSLEKLDPISGMGRLISKRSLVELAKSLFKVGVVGFFIYRVIKQNLLNNAMLINAELWASLKATSSMLLGMVFEICAVMLVLAALDFLYQNWEYRQNLKMSKHDVKQEFKQSEVDPQIKGKIKERQRAMAMQRMMQEVPKADVVITNPTHFAVALKYDNKMMAAPQIVAKGQDFVALRIKEIAKEHKVVIVENKPLARALHASTEVGDAVPAELYKSVAEVLAYVYRLKRRLS